MVHTLAAVARERPGLGVVLGAAVVAVVLIGTIGFLVGLVATVAHEGGHAVTAVLTGGSVTGIWVWPNRNGLTTTLGAARGSVADVLVGLGGYTAPSAFGLAASWLVARGMVYTVLAISLLFLACALVMARSWFTRLIVVAIGSVILLVLRDRQGDLVMWAACTWAWLLLIGGLADALDHFGKGGDHHALREATGLPVFVWSVVFVAFAAVALLYGARWMTGIDLGGQTLRIGG